MIVVVYHTYLVGGWKELIDKQLKRLIKSGLYENANEIWVTINLADNLESEVYEFFKSYNKIKLEFHTDNFAEYPGIKKVKELCEKYDCKIFYFHTKGVSNNWITFESKQPSQKKIDNVNSWRECMEYFLIDNWNKCIEKLETYDNVGVSCNNGWFSGNFWWSKSSHIRKTREVGKWIRWDYEDWLNRNVKDSTNFEFYHMSFHPFVSNLNPVFYKDGCEKFKEKKIIIKNAVYGTPSFEIDEGYGKMPLNIFNDVTENVKQLLNKEDGLKLFFKVNNENMGGDPIYLQRKFLIITLHPEGYDNEVLELGIAEEQIINFKF